MQFINAKESLVVDAIDGLLRSSGGAHLARLDGYPGIKVVLRTDHRPGRVAIVAGGGSGSRTGARLLRRQGHADRRGLGEVFASPSIDAVFAAIMAVTGKRGCLAHRQELHRRPAELRPRRELARARGRIPVEIVIDADDVALPDSSSRAASPARCSSTRSPATMPRRGRT